jgi:hypothetical protein
MKDKKTHGCALSFPQNLRPLPLKLPMKKTLLYALLVFAMQGSSAQCTELFISEYVEGSRNNKAIEIYNPTKASIDLSQYRFTRWQNGSAVWTSQFSDSLHGTIGPNEVRVLVLDRRDTTQTGQDTPVTEALRMKADLWLSPDYNTHFSMSFNGDDALSLDKKSGSQYLPIDIFGKIGEQPKLASNPTRTIGWSDSFPYNTGLGLWYTIDKTLIRKSSVTKGINTNPTRFNPSLEWTPYPENTFDSLRTHICTCNPYPAGLRNSNATFVSLFPNPAGNTLTVISALQPVTISLVATDGRQIPVTFELAENNGFRFIHIPLNSIAAGSYFLRITDDQGNYSGSRFIKE